MQELKQKFVVLTSDCVYVSIYHAKGMNDSPYLLDNGEFTV
jgi:hypothetical protein